MCEYVDGTMDPAARRAFEEYLSIDPALARQVDHLRRTRSLLCDHGCQMPASEDVRERMRRRLATEMMRTQPPFFTEAVSRLGTFAMVASLMSVTLLAGMLVGVELLEDPAKAMTEQAQPMRTMLSPRVAMSPLVGDQPMRQFQFVRQAAPVLPTTTSLLMPALELHPTPVRGGLQRTGGAP
jgi:anti-sigma factor RsiW